MQTPNPLESNWLQQLRQALTEQRLPSSFVEPFLDELLDHLDDWKEANMSIEAPPLDGLDAVMGNPRHLADEASGEYRRRTFLGRRPVVAALVFLLAPIPLVSLIAMTLMMIGQAVASLVMQALGAPALTQLGEHLDGRTALVLTMAAAQAAALWAMCGLAWRQRLSSRWSLLSLPSLAGLSLAMMLEEEASPGASALAVSLLPLAAWALAAWRYARLPLAEDAAAPRFPKVALLLRSFATTCLSLVAYALVIAGVMGVLSSLPGMDFRGLREVPWSISALLLGIRYVPFALAAWVCCRTLPGWAGSWWKGSLLACVAVALVASLFWANITSDGEQAPFHSFAIGLLWTRHPQMMLLQAVVPLAVWAACAWQRRRAGSATPALA